MNVYQVESPWARRLVEAEDIPSAVEKFKSTLKKENDERDEDQLEPTEVRLRSSEPCIR